MLRNGPGGSDRCSRYQHLDIGTTLHGKPARAIAKALADAKVAICSELVNKIEEVMVRKFAQDIAAVQADLSELLATALWVTVHGDLHTSRDRDDDVVLECARNATAQLIVTGNLDLLEIRDFEGIRLVTADQFLRLR